MKASETNLQAIIEGTKQYIIPMFQRTYSWEQKQWKQLWDDIVELIEDNDNQSHFIGSVVSIPVNANTHGVQQFLVIDGQQRMTTLLILLAATRDVAKKLKNNNLAEEIQHTLLKNSYKSGEDMYKFLPTQVDKSNFKKIINSDISTDLNNSRILKAYWYFHEMIEKEINDLTIFKSTITGDLSIVSIVLSPEDNPYLVFESLNAKGQPLTQADLIRNYLFMRIPTEDQEDQYTRYWLPMQEELGDHLTEFIRHFLLGENINVKKNDVYVKLKEKTVRHDAKEFLKNLSEFAEYYGRLLNPNLEDNIKIRKYIHRINDFEAKTAYPFLLFIYRDYKKNRYSADQFIRVLQIIENYLVRRFVCNIDSKSLNKIFASLYNQISIHEADQSIEEFTSYLQNRGYPKDDEFVSALKENHLYGQGDTRKKGSFILRAIEDSYSHKEQADLTKATVEHIMPQTLTDAWNEELGGNAEFIHSTYLHTLGNLTLSAYNTELSNEPFLVKRRYYEKSNLQMNKSITQYKSWNETSINSRTEELTRTIITVWPYFGKAENELRKITGSSPRLLTISEQSYSVRSWREVMEKTIITVFENNHANYQKIMDKYPGFISENGLEMRKARKIGNGHYMEANLSANAIHRFCTNAMEEAGYNKEEWNVEIESK
ncbi:DUF262 domain-containing protein [Virgibacillus sp. C22-A2]|uniref:DUF262 domain-containing protein n=1 Tax=Virgibacillus tibetensis TaxID=3042313 RepID=A0ABU6KJ97_9BACI|nr:DUF262 domain-containing protein [Virgibacillus sp. C22-A2]